MSSQAMARDAKVAAFKLTALVKEWAISGLSSLLKILTGLSCLLAG